MTRKPKANPHAFPGDQMPLFLSFPEGPSVLHRAEAEQHTNSTRGLMPGSADNSEGQSSILHNQKHKCLG